MGKRLCIPTIPSHISCCICLRRSVRMSRRRHGDKNNLAENTQEAAGRRLCSRSLYQVEWKLHKNWSKECCQKRAKSKISRGGVVCRGRLCLFCTAVAGSNRSKQMLLALAVAAGSTCRTFDNAASKCFYLRYLSIWVYLNVN